MAKEKRVNPRFGELLREGIASIARRWGKNQGVVEQEIDRQLGFSPRTLRRWQGGHIPSEEKIEKLARVIVEKGRVGSEWLEGLLYHARYSDAKGLRADCFGPRLFLSYQRGCKADENIVWPIVRALSPNYEIFWDQFVAITPTQIREIEKKLREADYVLFLFSTDSIRDEVVRHELEEVLKLRRADGAWRRVLPVWLRDCADFLEVIPPGLESFKWAFCEGDAGTAGLISDLQQAIAGGELSLEASDVAVQCQQMAPQSKGLLPPSPHTEQLRLTKGMMGLESKFYIEREVERRTHEALAQQGRGETIVIKGPRQMGKSSMLPRLEQTAIAHGKRFVLLDCNLLKVSATDRESFFSHFCEVLADELGSLDSFMASKRPLVSASRSTRFIGREILPHLTQPCVIALDNSESLFETAYRSDFFGMLRAWHNERASDESVWRQLDLVVVTSTEPHLFIDKLQSPFNVGEVIELADFTPKEVEELNRRYGKPLRAREVEQLMALVAGHPYLVRKALFLVASGRVTVSHLFAHATDDYGPFGDHLRALLRLLYSQDESLRVGFREVIRQHKCPAPPDRYADEMIKYRLQGAGLVRREESEIVPRNALYAQFFETHGI